MSKTLVEVITESGIDLVPSSGGRWVAVCPFHEGDRDPSFTVYSHNDSYYCFGCNAWGDPVKFLCDYKGMTSREAQAIVGIDYEYKKTEKAQVIKTKDTLRTWSYLAKVARLYHANLISNPRAFRYVSSRGISDDTIRSNLIGYTDGRVLSIECAEDFRIAHECGLVNEQGYEVMSHRITIPNITGPDIVDFIMGRTVTNDKIKYLGTRMPKPVYGFSEFSKSPILFMAEGQFDWLLLKQWGYPAVILSGSHLPKYHLMLLRDKFVVIIPDYDTTGEQTAPKLHASLINSVILDYKSLGVKDIGELGPDPGAQTKFRELLEEQEWYKTAQTHNSRIWRVLSMGKVISQ